MTAAPDAPEGWLLRPIGHVRTDFPTKFGVPRQAGLVPDLAGTIVFTPPYRNPDAVRGLDGFSHLWLVWVFDRTVREGFSPTVRPPRLGGNERLGVFATRSPFRPNPIGLSSVRLVRVDLDAPDAPVLHVAGADLVDGTPLLDIKPYLAVDCHPDAAAGFTSVAEEPLLVDIPDDLLSRIPETRRAALRGVLAQDPRPRYQNDPSRAYHLDFAGRVVRFTVSHGWAHVHAIDLAEPLWARPGAS